MVITNGERFAVESAVTGREVAVGEPILVLRAVGRRGRGGCRCSPTARIRPA